MENTDHFSYYWKRDRLNEIANFSTEDNLSLDCKDLLFTQIPQKLKKDVFQYLFSDHYHNFRFFFKHFSNARFEISRLFQPRHFYRYECILDASDKVKEIFFVTEVIINATLLDNFDENPFWTHRGYFVLGDYFFLKNTKPYAHFYAGNHVHGCAISSYGLSELIIKYNLDTSEYFNFLQPFYQDFMDISNKQQQRTEEEKLSNTKTLMDDLIGIH